MKFNTILSLLLVGSIASKAQLKIGDNTNLVITNGANLILNDLSLSNGNRDLTGIGKIIFSGSSSNNTISSAGAINNLTINKSSGALVKLANQLNAPGVVTLTSGKLDLKGFDLNLGSTGNLASETEDNHVTGASGYVISTRNLNAPNAVNPGNLGAAITSTSNLGSTIVRRGNYALNDGTNSTIQRFFEISPTNNINLNATVRFYYLEANLGSLEENQLKFITSSDGGATWYNLAAPIVNTAERYVEFSGLNGFGTYSLSNNFETLPITAIRLTGKPSLNGINLKWATEGEVNVSHFWLEKSADGKFFNNIKRVASLSNLRKDNNYETLDRNALKGANYYRVTSVDNNGDQTTSNPIAVNYDLDTENSVSIYPNPTTKILFGSFNTDTKQLASVEVISIVGKTEIRKLIPTAAGTNDFSLDVSQLSQGTYLIKINIDNSNKILKFIKK